MTNLLVALAAVLLSPAGVDPGKPAPTEPKSVLPGFAGLHFWSDVAVAGDWRVQQHAERRTYRLVDGAGKQHAAGGDAECRAALALRQEYGDARERGGKVVLLLHGLINTRARMEPMARRLQAAGFTTYCISYASTRLPIQEHAANLRRVVDSLRGAEEIDFVCHSMGGLIVRTYLADTPDRRVKRLVLLGTPNYGSERADAFGEWALFWQLFGPAGRQLKTDSSNFIHSLPPAPASVEIGVVAGGTGAKKGFGLLLPGDNDGIVTVESARLRGAADYLRVGVPHLFLPSVEVVRDATLRFLKEGRFRADGSRQPIPR